MNIRIRDNLFLFFNMLYNLNSDEYEKNKNSALFNNNAFIF